MTALETLALSTAQGLHRVLGQLCDLPQHGRGSCAEQAWNLMDVVIWYLDPHGSDEEMPKRRLSPYGLSARDMWPASQTESAVDARDRGEIRLMIEAGVSISDCASYFGASEAAVRQLLGESQAVTR